MLMVVAQLVERSLPNSEIRISNPVIGTFICTIINCIEKAKSKKNWPGVAQLKTFFCCSINLTYETISYSFSLECTKFNFLFQHVNLLNVVANPFNAIEIRLI